MTTEQLPGLQLAIALLAQIGDDDSDRAIAAVHDLADEHAQRLTLQHHAADQVWRIADLEVKCVTLKELHDAATDERDALRAKYDELLVALHGIGAALGIPEGDRSPYSVTCGVLERVNRLAEIELQEPVALVETSGDQGAGVGWSGAAQPVGAKLYASPVPAQAVPTGERQAVLLTDAEVRQIGDATLYAGGIYDRVRAIETAVLAANGLEVRRG